MFFLVLLCSCSEENRSRATGSAEHRESGIADAPKFVAYRREANFPIPDTWSDGVFRSEGDCLVLHTSSRKTFMPVLPPGLRVVASKDGALAGGSPSIVIGRRYRVIGGEGSYAVSPALPKRCEHNQFLVGTEIIPA